MAIMSIDRTYEWIAAFEKSFTPVSFLRNTFFPGSQIFGDRSEEVLMDYRKGSRRMAPFVAPGNAAPSLRDSFQTRTYKPPMIAITRPLGAEALKTRAFGEDPFNGMSGAERASQIRSEDYKDMHDMIERRIEWMCAQILTTGSFTAKGLGDDGDPNKVVTDTVTLQGWTNHGEITEAGDQWSNANADIWSQVDQIRSDMSRNAPAPTLMIASHKTCLAVVNNKSLANKILVPDRNTAAFLSIVPQVTSSSVTRYAVFMPGNIELYSYDDIYEDEAGNVQTYIPDGYVIFARPNLGKILSGAINQLNDAGTFDTVSGLYIPKEWSDVGSDVVNLRLASRSVPIPDDVESWYTLKVF